MTDPRDRLQIAVDRLLRQISHWSAARYDEPAGMGSRADLVYALTQLLADLAADAEGEPRRSVPRLVPDTALPDQLRVLTADLLAAGSPEALEGAAAEVARAARALS